jgi:hypothetical protein
LQSAKTRIAALGLVDLTRDRVAQQAGIFRWLVVFQFRSKTNLIEAVPNFLGKQYADGCQAALKQNSDSHLEKLLQLPELDFIAGLVPAPAGSYEVRTLYPAGF